jgi:hypothetical protein
LGECVCLHMYMWTGYLCDTNCHFRNGTKCQISCVGKAGPSFTLIR